MVWTLLKWEAGFPKVAVWQRKEVIINSKNIILKETKLCSFSLSNVMPTYSLWVGAAPEDVSHRMTSTAGPAPPQKGDVLAGRSARGPSPSWCRRWWRSRGSGTLWTPYLPASQTQDSENRRVCRVCLAPAWGSWWSEEKTNDQVQ